MLAVLMLASLKIYRYNRSEKTYKYETKVQLMLSSPKFVDSNNLKVDNCLPIFDGGICVSNGAFVIQYADKAEYLKFERH